MVNMDVEINNLIYDFNDLDMNESHSNSNECSDSDDQEDECSDSDDQEDECSDLPQKYLNFIDSTFEIISKDPTFNAEIVDNIIILDDVLFAINPELKKNKVYCKAILRLSEFHKQKIPQRNDPRWWDDKCSRFEDLMIHLRKSSYKNKNINNNFNNYNIDEEEKIKDEIIDYASNVVKKEYEFKDVIFNNNILNMYKVAKYLEIYFYEKVGSFYTQEIKYTSEYFTEFREYVLNKLYEQDHIHVLDKLYNLDQENYPNYRNLYDKYINQALSKLLYGAQNLLILFGPYGYDSLVNNHKILDLSLNEVFEFKREALKYFALNNLIELKLNNKKINLINSNDYVNIIFKGASLI